MSSMWRLYTLALIVLWMGKAMGMGVGVAATPALNRSDKDSDSTARTLEPPRSVDCKLTFNVVGNAATARAGQAQLSRLTMGSLEQLLASQDKGKEGQQQLCTVHVIWGDGGDKDDAATTNKPQLEQQEEQELGNNSQPVYEMQLVVWPTDIEPAPAPTRPPTTTTTTRATTTTTKPTTTTTASATLLPLYEDQLVVFPQMDFAEENLDYFFDDVSASSSPSSSSSSGSSIGFTSPPSTSSSSSSEPTVYVVQDYHVVHPNGTAEYKLVLSNGLVNYKKIYAKQVGDQVINVQEGYDSVPIPGRLNQYQTQYYIADELGFNVYKIEHNYEEPVLPNYLHYKAKNVATKPTKM